MHRQSETSPNMQKSILVWPEENLLFSQTEKSSNINIAEKKGSRNTSVQPLFLFPSACQQMFIIFALGDILTVACAIITIVSYWQGLSYSKRVQCKSLKPQVASILWNPAAQAIGSGHSQIAKSSWPYPCIPLSLPCSPSTRPPDCLKSLNLSTTKITLVELMQYST